MKINHIRLQRFGCFDDREIHFHAGLNIIKGPNEAGKSTLHQGLLMALLERPRRKKANEAFRAWGADAWYRLDVEFEDVDGETLLLVRDFENFSAELFDPSGGSIKSQDRIQAAIGDTLGTSSLGIFKSTVCVAQDALSDLSSGSKEIAESLEEIVTGGKADSYTQATINKLNKKITEYKRGIKGHAPVNPGPIARLRNSYRHLEDQIRHDGSTLRMQETDEAELKATRELLARIDKELKTNIAVRDKAGKSRDLRQKEGEWKEKEDNLREVLANIDKAEKELAEANKILSDLGPLSDCTNDDVKAVAKLQQSVEVLRHEKEQIIELRAKYQPIPAAPVPEKIEAAKKSKLVPLVSIGIGVAAGALGVFALLNQNLPVGLAGLILGLALLLFGVYQLAARRTVKSTVVPEVQETVDLPVFNDEQLETAEKELTQRLDELNCESTVEVEEKWQTVEEARQQQATAEGKLDVLIPDNKSKEEMESERGQASREASSIRDQLNDPGFERAAELDAVAYQNLVDEIKRLEERQLILNEKRLTLTGRVNKERLSKESLLRAQDQLEVVKVDLEKAKDRLAVYELMLETMETARERTLTRASDEIAPRLIDYFAPLTIGRYQSIEVDSDLNIRVRHPDQPNLLVEPHHLSVGTQDQLYLAARLALADLLFRDTNPPLFLDDPFVKFDPRRRQAAIELCQEVAKEKQVLLFTCFDHYDESGHLIELTTIW